MTSAATKSSVKRLCRSRTQYVLWNQKKVTAFSTICQIQKADLIYVLRFDEYLTVNAQIPKGKVATYGKIARLLHSSPRSVGQALKRNPFAPEIPCHRVIASDGKIGGFQGSIDVTSASVSQKRRLLISEGVVFKQEYQVDPICMHSFQGESFDCNMDAQVL
ncbi:unnamed protein product [Albugo candida]|uniref:Methylated-DNA--protein-cysteine methyltransferase n=1 Tax=Albugo candida TaxID=65357 RepID=A0A024GJ33_9STRA|nr:unnamed protein product [Albugo candida]|eukprot:CCI46716.1 unnamed protein product [Albugo candida]